MQERSSNMRIEFWVDYLCPITYLTHKNLLEALDDLKLQDLDIYYRSYPIEKDLFNSLKSDESVIKIIEDHFPNMTYDYFETDNIHQVSHLAKWQNLATEFNKEVLHRRFKMGEDINDPNVLLEIAADINLDVSETKRVIESCCYDRQINNNKVNAEGRGIKQIPHLRINMKNNFNGFLSKDELIEIIKDILNYKPKAPTECAGEVCDY